MRGLSQGRGRDGLCVFTLLAEKLRDLAV